MCLAERRTMLQRLASVLVSSAVLATATSAHAFGGWMAQALSYPVEQRVAVAVTPTRTTVWTSVRFDGSASPAALVLPVPPGFAAAVASDAWFEALEASTAPRIFPPSASTAFCPPMVGFGVPFDTAGHLDHVQSAVLVASALLPDLPSVTSWAQAQQLVMPPALAQSLGQLTGVQFLVVRFDPSGGEGVSPTIRITTPGATPTLPLALTAAPVADVLVTSWLLGGGTGQLTGASASQVLDTDLFWNAETQASNYLRERRELADSPADAFLEASTHDGLVADTAVAGEQVSIDGFLQTYFERAVAYAGAQVDPGACVALATPVFASSSIVAPSCPRATLGLASAPAPCTESVPAGTLDPAVLRCGPVVDDLAVALSGMAPSATWLTRQSLVIRSGAQGASWPLTFAAQTPVVPAWTATSVDVSNCPPVPPGGSSSGAGGSIGSGSPGSGTASGGSVDVGDVGDVASGVADSADSCDSSDTGSSGCSGDSGGDSGGGCSGGGDAGSCSGGGDIGSFDCAIGRVRAPRLSVLMMAALALLAPLRRRGRAARRQVAGRSRASRRGITSSPCRPPWRSASRT